MKYELKDYQLETVEWGLKNPYSILALEQGLGKTLCALEIYDRCPEKNLLVVCPSYLILNWKNEIKRFFENKYQITTFQKGSDIYEVWDTDIVITSYDLVQKASYLFSWANVVVADECNILKTMKAARTEFFHKNIFENSTKRLLLLTGTPIKNRVEEFYSLISMCCYNPNSTSKFLERFPDSITFCDYFAFRREFEMIRGNRRVKIMKWEGVRNTEELKKWLQGIYIRYSSRDVLNLAPIVFKDVTISDIDDIDLLEEFNKFYRENKTVSPSLKAKSALDKAPFTCKYVRGIMDDGVEEIVIYTDHVKSCEYIAERFGVTPIHAGTSMIKRAAIAKDFQDGRIKVIVATIGAFSTGVTLTKSHNLVFNDYSWVPGDMEQVIYRINRIGQERQCIIHRVFGSPQDNYIMKTLEQKIETIKKVY